MKDYQLICCPYGHTFECYVPPNAERHRVICKECNDFGRTDSFIVVRGANVIAGVRAWPFHADLAKLSGPPTVDSYQT